MVQNHVPVGDVTTGTPKVPAAATTAGSSAAAPTRHILLSVVLGTAGKLEIIFY